MRKVLAFILVLCMVFTMIPMSSYAEILSEPTEGGAVFADVNGHWASEAIYKWAALGIVKGDSRGFRPDAPITRAEMAAILDNLMDYQKSASNSFRDVDSSAWYADAVLKANAVGILNGDGAGHASPLSNITREQAAIMLARAFAVEENDGRSTSFLDKEVISPWARGLVFGMEADKYIGGTSNGIFEPKANITRAQVVTIIDNAVKEYYTKQGTYTDNVNPDPGANCVAIVRTDGVVIKGARINGDLIIAEGVAQGSFTLDSTTVTGKLVARGGGENSIHIINGAAVNGRVSIERVDGVVRVVSDGVVIANLDASTEVILEGNFTNVVVGEGAQVEVRGQISNINVEAKAEVTVTKDAKVGTLTVEQAAEGAKVEVAGTVTNIKTEAPKTEIIATETARVTHVEATETATGTDIAIDKKADIKTLDSATEVTTSGSGAPKTITGTGTVTQKETPASEEVPMGGGGGGGGIPGGGEPAASISGATINGTIKVNAILSVNTSTSGNVGTLTYQWYRTTTNGAFNTTSDAAIGASLSYQLTNTDKGNYIYYIVSGAGSLRKESNIVGPIEDPAVPTEMATNLSFTDTDRGTNEIGGTFRWSEPANHSNITCYNIYSSADGATKGTLITTAAVDTNQIAIPENTAYSSFILAVCRNATGESATSASIAITDVFNLDQAAPQGLTGMAPTSAVNDGKITGVTNAMEYKASGGAVYVAVTGTEVTGLTSGTYLVRYSAKEGYNAGADASVTVSEYVPPISPYDLANQIGIVITPPAIGGHTVGIYTSSGSISYNVENDVVINTIAGQFVTYAVNNSGNIWILNSVRSASQVTCSSITIASGFQVDANTYEVLVRFELSGINKTRTLDPDFIFAYSGTSPGALGTEYRVIDGSAINDGTINNPVIVYIDKDDDSLLAMLVPFSACALTNYDQPAPIGLIGIAPSAVLNDGKITGVTTAMEYSPLTGSAIYVAVTGTAISGLTTGTYLVRYAAKEGYNEGTPAAVTVPAYVPLLDQATPSGISTVTPTSAASNDGKIIGVTSAMEYKLSTEQNYHSITGTEVTGLTSGVYTVRYAAKEGYNAGFPLTIGVLSYGLTPPAAPASLNGVTPTSSLNNNGRITNVNNSMEYKLSTAENYIPVTGTEITGLASGTYLVRYKGGLTYLPSNTATVVVLEYATSKLGVFLSTIDSTNRIISVFNSDGQTVSYQLESWVTATNFRGQLISYSLNSGGKIQALNNDTGSDAGSHSVISNFKIIADYDSGLDYIFHPGSSQGSEIGRPLSGDEVVFTYNGSTPGAIVNTYKIKSLANVEYGTISSPCAFYFGSTGVDGILIPEAFTSGVKPDGLTGYGPTSQLGLGKITGVTTHMEYKLSTDENYQPVTGTEITGLSPGTYYIRYSAASPYGEGSDTVITLISSYNAANLTGIVVTPPAIGSQAISIFAWGGIVPNYTLGANVDFDLIPGQIVSYAVNSGTIGVLNSLRSSTYATNASITIPSGLEILSDWSVRYTLASGTKTTAPLSNYPPFIVTYSGATPGAINNEYTAITKTDLKVGTINSPVSIFISSEGYYKVLLVPFSACTLSTEDQPAPTGLAGVAPTSSANANGKISGTTTAMEYKLASAGNNSFLPCTTTMTAVALPGVYHVRFAQTGSLNAGMPATVTVPAYDGRSLTIIKDITNIAEVDYVKGSSESRELYLVTTDEDNLECSVLSLGTLTVKNGSDILTPSAVYSVQGPAYEYTNKIVFASSYLESLDEGQYSIELTVQSFDGRTFTGIADLFILPSTSTIYFEQPAGGGLLEVHEYTFDDDSFTWGSEGASLTSGSSVAAGGLNCILIEFSSIPANKHLESITIQEEYFGHTVTYNEENYNLTTDFINGYCMSWRQCGTVTINVVVADGAKNITDLQSLTAHYEDELEQSYEFDIDIQSGNAVLHNPNISPNAHISLTPIVARESAATVTSNLGVTLSDSSGAAIVVVTAEDNTTVRSYSVFFTVDRTRISAEFSDTPEFPEEEAVEIVVMGYNSSDNPVSPMSIGDSVSVYCDYVIDDEASGSPLDLSQYHINYLNNNLYIELLYSYLDTLTPDEYEITISVDDDINGEITNYRSYVVLNVTE